MVFGNFNRSEQVDILIYDDERPRGCEVMWSRDNFIGVRFATPEPVVKLAAVPHGADAGSR